MLARKRKQQRQITLDGDQDDETDEIGRVVRRIISGQENSGEKALSSKENTDIRKSIFLSKIKTKRSVNHSIPTNNDKETDDDNQSVWQIQLDSFLSFPPSIAIQLKFVGKSRMDCTLLAYLRKWVHWTHYYHWRHWPSRRWPIAGRRPPKN